MDVIGAKEAIKEITNIATSKSGGSFYFIVGAGVSFPQVPLAMKIIDDHKQFLDSEISDVEPMKLYSGVLSARYPSRLQQQCYFKDLIKGKPISRTSLRLALLMQDQTLTNILVTPNFDDFVTRALRLIGEDPHLCSRPESLRHFQFSEDRPSVVHVHGVVDDYDISSLEGDITDRSRSLNSDLWARLQGLSPIVLGYSGWRGDVIMTALEKSLQGPLPQPLYWCCYNHRAKEQLPNWLTDHRDVKAVVADVNDDNACLDACQFLDDMIYSLRLPPPSVALDPLGSLVRQLRETLPDEPEEGDWRDLYLFSQQMRGLFPNRAALGRTFHPVQIVANADNNSTIFAAGRTLKAWATIHRELLHFAETKDLRFQFLLSEEAATHDLEETQQTEVREDRGRATACFTYLQEQLGFERCDIRETPHLIIDGLTIATVKQEYLDKHLDRSNTDSKVICQFDINAAAGKEKPTLVFACTCSSAKEQKEPTCIVHGLEGRTQRIFNSAKPLISKGTNLIEEFLWRQERGLPSRRNDPQHYAGRSTTVLEAVQGEHRNDLPPPMCVQLNVCQKCDTRCQMCDHWMTAKRYPLEELSLEKWKRVTSSLNSAGVRTIVVSGGEPLAYRGIDGLLNYVRDETDLRIGLLTSGLIEEDEPGSTERFERVCTSLRERVDWIAVSIDGTLEIDNTIRNPFPKFEHRSFLLRRFCEALKGGNAQLTATVTLQKENISQSPEQICSFIRNLGIDRVNFKFATGDPATLSQRPDFLIQNDELDQFIDDLFQSPVPNQSYNNLDYLRRCFAAKVFTPDDVVNGCPVKSYYKKNPTRCYTPFLFSFIDTDGSVYPCCHLYRDNHGVDSRSRMIRESHCLGKLSDVDYDFMSIWNNEKYVAIRRDLELIDPKNPTFAPCGECTRHVQPNIVYKTLQEFFNRDPGAFGDDYDPDCKSPVWF